MIEIIEKYFQDNPEWLISHQFDSYHDFIFDKIKYIIETLQEEFTIIESNKNGEHFKIELYVGGLDNQKIYISRPTIEDENGIRPLYPNEARLKDITYAVDIFADMYIRATYFQSKQELKKKGVELKDEIVKEFTKERVKLCSIPIMVKSKMCSLYKQPANILTELGECPYDKGGYFIISGKEKVIVSQEQLVTNRLFVNKINGGTELEKYKFRAQVRNTEEDNTLFPKVIKFYIYNESYMEGKKHNAIVVQLPVKSKIDVKNTSDDSKDLESVNKEVPLCVLFRALGVESDKEIAKYILMNDDFDNTINSQLINFLEPTFHDGSVLYTQMEALNYLQQFTQFNKFADESEIEKFDLVAIQNVLIHEIFPNVGNNFKEKAFILGYYINIFIKTSLGMYSESERDNYMHKRVNVPGNMMISIFRDFYNKFRVNYRLEINLSYSKNALKSLDDIEMLFNEKNLHKVLKTYEITEKIIKSFKGDWGLLDSSPENAEAKRQRQGYVQDLSRLSYVGTLCHLRRIRTPMNTEIKIVEPHKLHPSQWGILCPSESPDGSNIGIIKHLAMTAYITGTSSLNAMKHCLSDHGLIPLGILNINNLGHFTKILINDTWVGIHKDPFTLLNKLRLLKRNAIISIFTGISWNIYRNELNIRIDNGRCVRPLFIVDDGELLIKKNGKFDENMKKNWFELISGSTMKADEFDMIEHAKVYRKDLLGNDYKFDEYDINKGQDKKLNENGSVIEYIDIEDANYHVISMHETDLVNKSHVKFSYCELHPSLALSVYTNTIPFSHHNTGTRNVFSGAQGKQALGMYATNFNQRIDTSGYILHYPQKPLVNNKYDVYSNMDMLPNGENLIVSIMTYSGYNQEDAVIFNRKAIERGCHNVTAYHSYEDEEKVDPKRKVKKLFGNAKTLQGFNNIEIKKADYSTIDELGFPIENKYINDKSVILGKYVEEEVNYNTAQASGQLFNQYQINVSSKKYKDDSHLGSRLMYGHIDKVYKYAKNSNEKKVKIRIRNFKMPRLGDKLGSRHGQKGVCGMILDEEDMPYNKDGIRPDIIINPHAIPTRMTVGHMLETVFAKLGALSGRFIDATAFNSKYVDTLYDELQNYGYDKYGDELLYNGKTGEQMESKIFMGPIFYYRLKHMVADKINWRGGSKMLLPDGGKVSSLTRIAPHGRSQEGGLRAGEMEISCLISYGISSFLKETMFDRADLYTVMVNNETGYIPTYNLEKSKLYNYGNNVEQIFLPYTYKLMTHEAQALGIKQRFITEKTSYYNDYVKPIEVYDEKNDIIEEINIIEDDKDFNKMD